MTKQHVNFYENLKEANLRLNNTIVLYDGEPYYVLCICDHKSDGIFRVYMDHLGNPNGPAMERLPIPYEWYDEPGGPSRGQKMDEWLDKNPNEGVIRKMMNSPLFNKFRPFPLGMCNFKDSAFYLERTPVRYTQQGLTHSMINYEDISVTKGPKVIRRSSVPSFTSYEMYLAIKGVYPSAKECIDAFNDPDVTNQALGFDRSFAFVRGPIGLIFLAYKSDIVGYMPHGDLSCVKISPEFKYTKEVVERLNLFEDIRL